MDLRSKLGLYKENSIKKASCEAAESLDTIRDFIPGAVCCNEAGAFYCVETRYPVSSVHGGCRLESALRISGQSLLRLCPDDGTGALAAEKLLFLDTETTGLSGGAGTVAFLVGVGYFQEDSFRIRQFFMRDYNEEAAMLLELNRLLPEFEGLVTFNGKAFDWNLLQGRFISNRIRPALSSPVHIDLLFPSRRIWGLKLESCRLSSLEENVLGEKRTDDIPGSMIPAVYFKYLEDRDATDIRKVVKHNELDILSMVSLLSKITAMLENPVSESSCEQELLGLGKIFQKNGEQDSVIHCYEFCARSENFTVKAAAVKQLTGIYKRSGNYAKALKHWEAMLKGSSGFYLFPMIEMAMYYEHKEKNAARALEIIEKAMELSLQANLRDKACFAELKKRHDRLKKKALRRVSN